MSYLLSSTTIRSPLSIDESNSTQVAQNRTLAGTVTRDYFGSNKRVWTLEYRNTKKADYDTIIRYLHSLPCFGNGRNVVVY
jgi:hypothetical protein